MGGLLNGKPSGPLAGDDEGLLSGQEGAGPYEPPISIREPHPGGPPGHDRGPVQLDLFGAVPFPANVACRGASADGCGACCATG